MPNTDSNYWLLKYKFAFKVFLTLSLFTNCFTKQNFLKYNSLSQKKKMFIGETK